MPVNWTSGKRLLTASDYPTMTVNNSDSWQRQNCNKLFSKFTFASHINQPPLRSRGLLEENIVPEPSTQPASAANSTVHTQSGKSRELLTNAEKRDSLLKMKSWTWLLKSNEDPIARQDKIDNGVISHHLSRYNGDHASKADMKKMGYQNDGPELSLPVSSPGIREGDLTREINGSHTSLSNKTDRQSDNDLPSSTIEESEGSQSAGKGIPHQIISYKESEHYSEDQEMKVPLGYDSVFKEPAPSSQKDVEDTFTKFPESPLEVKGHRMPTLQHKYQTIPSLLKSIEGSRRRLPKVTSNVIRASNLFVQISEEIHSNSKGGNFTKRTISNSDTIPERDLLSYESDKSFSEVSNLEFISSLNSPSPKKEPIRTESKTISTGSSDLDYQNDSMILQPSDFGVTTSQEDIIEFSDSGMNSTSRMVTEDLEDPLMEINPNVKPVPTREESEGVPETPEWLKREQQNERKALSHEINYVFQENMYVRIQPAPKSS
ncbi:uncharacterized protein MELLADRAFT_59523 [Melampsora larici-populina 98AG31]|uniref:Uncharacterized protein n=1 Tax=Melampsora larici-populina (strain 98AG31 / pathotype 3-4-7) TaxID=747676 RepID=F4R7T2_MELLP|nr:uncharacterized protein MELLADRAFT_59523 [Melampsora larici-populina 98AG31]EGG11369.1 hypothetical protein MELLADRAFT_59523 [Melampsora larici-populina 98AG31]